MTGCDVTEVPSTAGCDVTEVPSTDGCDDTEVPSMTGREVTPSRWPFSGVLAEITGGRGIGLPLKLPLSCTSPSVASLSARHRHIEEVCSVTGMCRQHSALLTSP